MLTYCTNIHPAESWAEVFEALSTQVPRIRDGFASEEPFPLCLWLSGRAALELDDACASSFLDWCVTQHVSVAALNGFPYGAFHGERVKERAYLPDWRDPERLAHTQRLTDLLAFWMDAKQVGVLSTVPLGFGSLSEDWSAASKHLVKALERLDRVAQRNGKDLVLALEPEPACALETTQDVLRYVPELELSPDLRRHLGICFDCCHQAVEFESAAACFAELKDAGIPVVQIHVSSALRAGGGALASLARFAEPCYLHQTVGRTRSGELLRFVDLDEALAAEVDGPELQEWRVHFHVPVDAAEVDGCATTQADLEQCLASAPPQTPFVVETYSLGVLPTTGRRSVVDSVVRELRWVKDRVAGDRRR